MECMEPFFLHCYPYNRHETGARQRGPDVTPHRSISGFTLIELMFAIVIIAVLMAIADPSYRYITNSNRMAAEVNGLLGDMQYARSEAIKRGQNVTVCESSDGSSCGAATAWHK